MILDCIEYVNRHFHITVMVDRHRFIPIWLLVTLSALALAMVAFMEVLS